MTEQQKRHHVAAVLLAVVLGWPAAASAQSYTFTYFSGSSGGPGAIDGAGSAARFGSPWGIARSSVTGNLYVVDTRSLSIRVVTPANVVSSLVGSVAGTLTNGRRSEVRFWNMRHLAIDGSGNLYLADASNHVIHKITPLGEATTLAGSAFVSGSNDATGTDATFNWPTGIAFDASSGNIYVADRDNHTIRRIAPAGEVTTLAGLAGEPGTADGEGSVARLFRPEAVATDTAGNIYVADTDNHAIRKITPAGTVSTLAGLPGAFGITDGSGSAARFLSPRGVAVDGSGNVYVADTGNQRIRKVTASGVVTTLAGSSYGHLDGTGTAARFATPTGITADGGGTVYVTEQSNHTIRRVTAAGVVTTIAGKAPSIGAVDGQLSSARYNFPMGLAFDPSGNLFVADQYNHTLRKITTGGAVNTFAGTAGEFGHADGAGAAVRFDRPVGVSSDPSGNLYIADASSHTIRKVTPEGVVSTFAGVPYSNVTEIGTEGARFNHPTGTTTDGAGNVYVADRNNHAIRKITPAGVVSTLAGALGEPGGVDGTGGDARFHFPAAVAVDSGGNVYVADHYNDAVRKITPAGVVTTFAGAIGEGGTSDGVGTAARLSNPQSIAVDSMDNVYVGEDWTIRHITSGGVVTTIAGTFNAGQANQDGTGPVAKFTSVSGIAVDASGRVFVADSLNGTIRVGAPALGAAAAIDATTGPAFATRQLSTSPNPGTTWQWDLIRKPAGSSAAFSSSSVHNPTFTPDVADLYVFRLTTTSIGPFVSITDVALTASCQSIAIAPSSIPHPLLGWPYSQPLTATPSTGPSFSVVTGDLPGGLTLSAGGTLSGTPNKAGTYTFTVAAVDVAACAATPREYTLTVGTLPAPVGLIATGSSASVSLSWNPVGGAVGYRIFRKGPGAGAFSAVGTSAGPGFTDSSVAASTTYVYRVRALDPSLIESPDSNSDLATTFVFTDPTLVGGATVIRALHITELRSVVNQTRALAGLAGVSFIDAVLTGVRFKAVHITELRSALNAARFALGIDTAAFNDSSLAGVHVKGFHVAQIRDGVQ